MSEKDLEALVTEILASSQPYAASVQNGKVGGGMPDIRRQPPIAKSRKRRPPRNPLYASLRLIILGLVILLVPLLFSAKRVHPPRSTITGALDLIAPYQTAMLQPVAMPSPPPSGGWTPSGASSTRFNAGPMMPQSCKSRFGLHTGSSPT